MKYLLGSVSILPKHLRNIHQVGLFWRLNLRLFSVKQCKNTAAEFKPNLCPMWSWHLKSSWRRTNSFSQKSSKIVNQITSGGFMNRRWRARVEPTFTAELTLYRRRKVGKNSSHSVFGNSQRRIRCDHDLGHARGNLVASSVSSCATAIFQSIRGTYGYRLPATRGSKKSLSLTRSGKEQYCSAEPLPLHMWWVR